MRTIFDLIRDSRPVSRRVWCLLSSILINVLILGVTLFVAQVSAVRQSSGRMMAQLRRELSAYRIVLLMPARSAAAPVPAANVPKTGRSGRKASREPKPLAVPDPRLLQQMDPQVAGFVRENPQIEAIVTREIVRDLDTGALDPSRLLRKSRIRISFEIDDAGRIAKSRVEQSSTVPSIDHLVLELVQLLEKYQILWAMKGLRRVTAEVRIGDQVVVNLEGEVRNTMQVEDVRRRIQGALTFLRLALAQDDAAFMLDNAQLNADEARITLSKAFEKEPLVAFLTRYYQAQPAR